MLQVHGVVDVQHLQTLQHALEKIVSVEGVRVDEKLGRLDVSTALQILTLADPSACLGEDCECGGCKSR